MNPLGSEGEFLKKLTGGGSIGYILELAVVEDHVVLSSPFNHGIEVFLKNEDIVAG